MLGLTASLSAGTFANGNGTLIYTITGTPTTSGTASFEISIGGITCKLLREVYLPEAKVTSLNCSSTTNNVLIYGAVLKLESPFNLQGFYNFGFGDSTLNYGWGNGVLANKSIRGELKLVNSKDSLAGTELSEDFTGKIALIFRGGYSYAIKALNAQKAGAIAVIFMNHGVQTDGSINNTQVGNISGMLTGETATNATGLQVKIPVIIISKEDRDKILTEIKKGSIIKANVGGMIINNVDSTIFYTGGNGGTYKEQVIPSVGVTGLKATLDAGIISDGTDGVDGKLIYTISGFPSSVGNASFAINIGDKSCLLNISVVQSIGKPGPVISDVDGNSYNTVYIGNQQWMSENLKVSKYNDGTSIPNVTDSAQWTQLTNGAWVYHENNQSNNDKYGKLYNWYTVSTSMSWFDKNVCPTGWHVPTHTEWTVLTDFLGGENVAIGKLKEVGTTNWPYPNIEATNITLFSALPSGFRIFNGSYSYIGLFGDWWSSTEHAYYPESAWGRQLYYDYNSNSRMSTYSDKKSGMSIRCLKGDPAVTSIKGVDCGTATHNGVLSANSAVSGVSSVISYGGGNGKPFTGQSILSVGVSGLTATLASGTFANGNGTLNYQISGTPSEIGIAYFAINIGGKSCTISRNIIAPTSGYAKNISDKDGNTYKTVYIGTQQWMAENLKVTKYNDGSSIPNVDFLPDWNSLTTGAWAYYSSVTANNDKYGKLYNWYVVNPILNGNKNVCPTGWHVPTDSEWTVLIEYLGGENIAGGKMKEAGLTSWVVINIDATNSSLFTGLPGGYRSENNFSDILGKDGRWWSSSEYDSGSAKSLGLYYTSGGASSKGRNSKGHGLSIRCLKD